MSCEARAHRPWRPRRSFRAPPHHLHRGRDRAVQVRGRAAESLELDSAPEVYGDRLRFSRQGDAERVVEPISEALRGGGVAALW